jgi:chlorite dismutase
MRRLVACCAFLLFASFAAAQGPGKDELEIRDVISRQLDAFKRDDAAAAFALATEGIRAQFGTPENFMLMVRASYPAVYRHSSVRFEKIGLVAGITTQAVTLTDNEGRAWLALYPMQREKEGWRINGCQLVRAPGQAT